MSNVWQQAREAWIRQAERRSEHTARAYERSIRRFEEFVGKPLDQVGGADAQAWMDDLWDQDLAESTINAYLSAVSSFYEYCIARYTIVVDGREQGLTDYNPFNRVERLQVDKYDKVHPLTIDELRLLLRQFNRSTYTGARNYALVLMAVLTCRRSAELRGLRWSDINRASYRWEGKRGARGIDEMPVPVWAALTNVVRLSGREPRDGDPVFTSERDPTSALSGQYLNQMVKEAGEQVGIEGVTFHALRHTGAHLLQQAGYGVLEISRRLGHKRLDTTQIYLSRMEGEAGTWPEIWEALMPGAPRNGESSSVEKPEIPVWAGGGGTALGNDLSAVSVGGMVPEWA